MMSAYINKPEETTVSKYTPAQMRAVAKYQKKAYDGIKVRAPKGYRDEVLAPAAKELGMSVNEFIWKAVAEKFERDGLNYPSVQEWKDTNPIA